MEWQLYLVAPLAFAWAVPNRIVALACAHLCVVLVLAARHVLSIVQYGEALPFNVECFSWVQPATFSTTPGSTPAA